MLRKKVLIIGYVWPEPASSAAGVHILSLIRLFKRQEWLVEFASSAQVTEFSINLESEGVSSQTIVLNCDSFDRYITNLQPDIVLFDRFMMEEQFAWRVEKNCPHTIKILDTEDLQCLRHARHAAFKAKRNMSQQDLFSELAMREIAAILRCDISLIISSVEMELLINEFKVESCLLHYLPFMIDVNDYPKLTCDFSERKNFITIGNFRHAPNWDMVLYLKEIWPLIRKKIPQAEMHIYGAYTPPKAMQLNDSDNGFLIKGRAKDVLVVMEQSKVCLAPIRFGAGIKGKLIDAMLGQTPSVTTDVGSESMHNGLPWPGAIENNKLAFAEAAIALYCDEGAWVEAQKRAVPILSSNYDSKVLGNKFIDKITQVEKSLEQHRLNNFTGAMLKHHFMKSTQYMSQWIEEKNKKLP